jgi:hypothetical protein
MKPAAARVKHAERRAFSRLAAMQDWPLLMAGGFSSFPATTERSMFVLTTKNERFVALALAALMMATRIHHFGISAVAPDASTAVFFLAGLMLASPLYILAFSALALALDMIALGPIGVADACMSSGYWLLFAGYVALWFAGRIARGSARIDFAGASKLFVIASIGTFVFFVLSNVGYYLGSDYASLSVQEYVQRVSRYLPYYWLVTLVYVTAGIAVFALAARGRTVSAAR